MTIGEELLLQKYSKEELAQMVLALQHENHELIKLIQKEGN